MIVVMDLLSSNQRYGGGSVVVLLLRGSQRMCAYQLLTAPTVSLASAEEPGMSWDAEPCLMVLIYSLSDGEGRVSPGDSSELGVLSLRISCLVTSCCIRRSAFFSSFHVLFKMLSYSESAANSLNVICLSVAFPSLFFFPRSQSPPSVCGCV